MSLQDIQAAGVGHAYAATLQSSSDIMAALQRAHCTRKGILKGASPLQLHADPLPEIPDDHTFPQLSLSPDSHWCACSYEGWYTCAGAETCGLYLYETHSGKLVHCLCRSDVGGFLTHWSACSARLSVLMGVNEYHEMSLVVYDAVTGQGHKPAWSPDAVEALQGDVYDSSSKRDMMFSPDGELLLRWRQDADLDGGQHDLQVLSLQHGSLEAASALVASNLLGQAQPDMYHLYRTAAARMLWHPSSRGIVIPGSTYQLADPQAFHQAGLAVGHCPPPAHLGQTSAFSPSGDLLLAAAPDFEAYGGQAAPDKTRMTILQVVEHDLMYSFTMLHMLEDPVAGTFTAAWCPCALDGEEVLLLDDGRGMKLVAPSGQSRGLASLTGHRLFKKSCTYPPPAFSPCGQLCQLFSCRDSTATPRVFHCPSSQVLQLAVAPSHDQGQELLWPASGSCLILAAGRPGDHGVGQAYPFTVLRWTQGQLTCR